MILAMTRVESGFIQMLRPPLHQRPGSASSSMGLLPRSVVDEITNVINKNTDSKQDRKDNFQTIWNAVLFRDHDAGRRSHR
jgi:hypothetical protein